MYDELVKRLRSEAVYLPEKFSKNAELLDVLMKAADAIEEVTAMAESYKRSMKAWADTAGKATEQIPRWIPVTERLPDHLTSVIVHRKDGGIFIWEYFDTSPTDDCWIGDSMNVYSFYDVTHWMPLPAPPKGE